MMLATRGKLLLPGIQAPETLATDAFGCAILTLGLIGLLIWRQPPNPTKRLVAAAFALYHTMTTAGATLQALGGQATAAQGWGSVGLHCGTALWFLVWLVRSQRAKAQ